MALRGSMNIHAKPGAKVIFHGEGGYDHDKEIGRKHLTAGATYTVERTEVGRWHTDVILREVPTVKFNSVMFEDAE